MPASPTSPFTAHLTRTGGFNGAGLGLGLASPAGDALAERCEAGALGGAAVPPHAAIASTSRVSAIKYRGFIKLPLSRRAGELHRRHDDNVAGHSALAVCLRGSQYGPL